MLESRYEHILAIFVLGCTNKLSEDYEYCDGLDNFTCVLLCKMTRPPLNLYEAHQKSRKYKQDKNILTILHI